MAAGKHTRAVGKLWHDGAAEPKKFVTKSGHEPPSLLKTDLTQPPRRVTKPEPCVTCNGWATYVFSDWRRRATCATHLPACLPQI
jgi:hypothetical protein